MMQRKSWLIGILLSGAASVIAGIAPAQTAGNSAPAAKIVLNAKFGQIVSNSTTRPGFPPGDHDVELGQEVRIDSLSSPDPDWDGATLTVYEQNLSYASHGTYRTFGLIATREGETAYLEVAGKWDVVRDGQSTEAPFEGEGKLLGGTGKLEGMTGSVLVKGKVAADASAAYSVEITPDH